VQIIIATQMNMRVLGFIVKIIVLSVGS